ncbi:MAG: hypothetical protein ACREOJ_08120 [Gemmatimonadaceae bacterium]
MLRLSPPGAAAPRSPGGAHLSVNLIAGQLVYSAQHGVSTQAGESHLRLDPAHQLQGGINVPVLDFQQERARLAVGEDREDARTL